jgi:hypothetical protein
MENDANNLGRLTNCYSILIYVLLDISLKTRQIPPV